MSTDFSFFDDIVGRAASKPAKPKPTEQLEDKAIWPAQPSANADQKRPEAPISFEASRFSSDRWNPDQDTISAPDEPLGGHRQAPRRRKPRPLSSIGEVLEVPKQAVEQAATKEEMQPLLPAPSTEEFARARKKEMANRVQPQDVSESSRAWSKTVETIRAI